MRVLLLLKSYSCSAGWSASIVDLCAVIEVLDSSFWSSLWKVGFAICIIRKNGYQRLLVLLAVFFTSTLS